jgi:hypothetical protein
MSKRKKNIDEFFARYESNFNRGMGGNDVSNDVINSFSECFTESTPGGVNCAKNGKEFASKVKQGMEFYRSIGTRSMTISSTDITLLDELHAMAKVYWRYTYEKDRTEGHIDFHVFYFLTTVTGELKIFAFIAGDEMKALREKGLVPEEAEAQR